MRMSGSMMHVVIGKAWRTLVTFRMDMSVLSFLFKKFRNSSADLTPLSISSRIARSSGGSFVGSTTTGDSDINPLPHPREVVSLSGPAQT